MQSCTSANDRILPDTTCLSSCAPAVDTVSTAAVNPPCTNNTSRVVYSNSIEGLPPECYEFVISSNGVKVIKCKICQYMSNRMHNLKRHFINKHTVRNDERLKMLECCGIRFPTKGEKLLHTKSVHKSGYKCSICSIVVGSPEVLERHFLTKHTYKKPYKCSLCAYQTPSKSNAKRHIQRIHSENQHGDILFVTDDGKQIQMEVESKDIKVVMEKDLPFELYEFVIGSNQLRCKICQYMSNKMSNLKRHCTTMHFEQNEESSKMLECCGIRFSTKGEKVKHTKSVHESGYKCSICSTVFTRPSLLQRHLAKHTGKMPYKCSLCAYQTPVKSNAKRHIQKKHSDDPGGHILYVTGDGEEIKMDTVFKGIKHVVEKNSFKQKF